MCHLVWRNALEILCDGRLTLATQVSSLSRKTEKGAEPPIAWSHCNL